MNRFKIRVYRSDGDVKLALLTEYDIKSNEELLVFLVNLLLKNFNMLVEIVQDNNNNNYTSDNGDPILSSNDNSEHNEYWFGNI